MENLFYKYINFILFLVVVVSAFSGFILCYVGDWSSDQAFITAIAVFLFLMIPVAFKMHKKPRD